jgi:hypothetical protein
MGLSQQVLAADNNPAQNYGNGQYSAVAKSMVANGGRTIARTVPGRNSFTPIPARNGNTGINGSGMPQAGFNAAKRFSPIPFQNGNTGINGSGMPQSGFNAGPANAPGNGRRYYNPALGLQPKTAGHPPATFPKLQPKASNTIMPRPSAAMKSAASLAQPRSSATPTLDVQNGAVSQAARAGALKKSRPNNFISGLGTPPTGQRVVSQPPLVPGSKPGIDRNTLKGMSLKAGPTTQATSIPAVNQATKSFAQMNSGDRNKAVGAFIKNGGANSTRSIDPFGVILDAGGAPAKVAVGVAEGFADVVFGSSNGSSNPAPANPNPPSGGSLLPVIAVVTDTSQPEQKPVKKLGKRPIIGQVAQKQPYKDLAKQMVVTPGTQATPATPTAPATPATPATPSTPAGPMGGGTGGGFGGGFGGWRDAVGSVLPNLPIVGGFGGGGGQMIPSAPAEPIYASQAVPVYAAPAEPVYAAPAGYEAPVQYTASRPIVVDAGSVDLVLEDVKLFEDATVVAGPAYSVRFRNQGISSSGKFVVAAVASADGKLSQDAPKTIMEVPGLAAGEMRELTLRLPRCEFRYLIIMIDATDAVGELDESNNSAGLEKGAL